MDSRLKMYELFTAYYSDKDGDRVAVYEKTLDWIYAHQNERSVEIRPTIWLWKTEKPSVYFVDFVGDSLGCTLDTFDTLEAAQEYSERVGQMTKRAFENWLFNVRWKRGGEEQ